MAHQWFINGSSMVHQRFVNSSNTCSAVFAGCACNAGALAGRGGRAESGASARKARGKVGTKAGTRVAPARDKRRTKAGTRAAPARNERGPCAGQRRGQEWRQRATSTGLVQDTGGDKSDTGAEQARALCRTPAGTRAIPVRHLCGTRTQAVQGKSVTTTSLGLPRVVNKQCNKPDCF